MLRSRLQIPAYVNVRLNRPPYTFFEDYIDLQYVDVVFICSMNMEVKAHRLVLASASPFLKELLMTSNQEIIYISVPDVNHRILKRLLNYLYVGVTKVKESDLASLKDVLSLLQIHLPSVNVSSEIPPPLVPISGINEQRGAIFVENGECSAQTAEQQNANVTSGKRSMNCPDSNKRFKPSTLSTVPANQGEDSGIFEAMCTQMIESFISTEKAVVEVPAAFSDSSGTKSGYVPQDPLDISSVEGDSASDFTATQNNVAGMKTEKTDDMEDMPLGYIDSTSDTVDEQSELCDFKPETEAVIIKSEKTYIEEGDIIPVLEPEVSLPDTELDESATDLAFDSCVDSTSELQAGKKGTTQIAEEMTAIFTVQLNEWHEGLDKDSEQCNEPPVVEDSFSIFKLSEQADISSKEPQVLATSSEVSLTKTISVSVSTAGSRKNLDNSQNSVVTASKTEVYQILCKTLHGKALLSQYENCGLLDHSGRKRLCHLIVDDVLREDPDRIIEAVKLQDLANQIATIFKKERASTYFVPYMSFGPGVKRFAKGKLFDCFHNRKRQLRTTGVIPVKLQSKNCISSQSRYIPNIQVQTTNDFSIEEVEESVRWLANCSGPAHLAELHWDRTARYRLNQLATREDLTISSYLNDNKPLNQPYGYLLIYKDFRLCYPEKDSEFLLNFQSFKPKIYDIARNRLRKRKEGLEKEMLQKYIECEQGDPATLEEYGEISGLSEETTKLSTDMQDSEVLILNGNKSSAASGSATKNQKSDEFVKTHLPDECGYPQYECTICTKKFKTLRSTRYHISRTHQICNKHNVPVSQCKHPKTKRKPSSSKVPSPENKCEGVSSSNNPL